MKVRVVCRKVRDYIRYDLKEIAFPSSLPDPPHIKKRRKLTWHERFLVLKEASRLYAASWVRDIGPELRPNDYKKDEESESEPGGSKSTTKDKEPSTLEDLAVAARGGMETLKPALQRIYMTRASAYRDALKVLSMGTKKAFSKSWRKRKILNPTRKVIYKINLLDIVSKGSITRVPQHTNFSRKLLTRLLNKFLSFTVSHLLFIFAFLNISHDSSIEC